METKVRYACRYRLARPTGVNGLQQVDRDCCTVTTVPEALPLKVILQDSAVRWEGHPSLACSLVHTVLECDGRILRIMARLARAHDENWLEFAEACASGLYLPTNRRVVQVTILRPGNDTCEALLILNDMADLHCAGNTYCSATDQRQYILRYGDF